MFPMFHSTGRQLGRWTCRVAGRQTGTGYLYWNAGQRTQRSLSQATNAIGFVGLGNMGLPMAINLAKHYPVVAFDTNETSMIRAEEEGIRTVDSVATVGKDVSTIITMLPGCNTVHGVLQDLEGVLQQGNLIIDCSTVSPTTSRHWQKQLSAIPADFVDAPVSGGVKGATEGTLTFMVGTSSLEAMNRTTPILECMGKRIIPCGGSGAGAATKLCNNLALAAQMAGICEALNLGEALGVDPVVLTSVLSTSTAKCWSVEVNNPHPLVAQQVLDGKAPAAAHYRGGFGSSLMLKDLGLATSAGQDVKVALPIGVATKELYQLLEQHGLGDRDFGVLLEFLRGGPPQD